MAVLSFVRNVIIARLLSVEDFGIAATFSLVITLIETTSQLALDKYIIKSRYGSNRRIIDTSHTIMLIRGLITSAVLFVFAAPVARLFELPDLIWVYQVLAIVPAIRGFIHLGSAVQQKGNNFITLSMMDFVSQVLGTLLLPLLLWGWPDYRAVLYVTILISVLAVVTSHIFSKGYFRFGFNKAVFFDAISYSWPLLLSGILIFLVLQGDRMIVASFYTLEELAVFTVVFSLLSMPVLVLSKIFFSLYLPRYSQEFLTSSGKVGNEYFNSLLVTFSLSFLMLAGFTLLGNMVIKMVYGDSYLPELPMLFLLSLSMAIRMTRSPAVTVGLASGKSKISLYINISRAIVVFPAIYFAQNGYSIDYILGCAVAGEVISYFFGYFLVIPYVARRAARMLPFILFIYMTLMAICCYYFAYNAKSYLQEIANFTVIGFVSVLPLACLYFFAVKKHHSKENSL